MTLFLLKGKATEIANEVRRFYEESEDTVWINFYANLMWWCFAQKEVERLSDCIRLAFAEQLTGLVINAGLIKWLIEKNK